MIRLSIVCPGSTPGSLGRFFEHKFSVTQYMYKYMYEIKSQDYDNF
jgi:hypothetical protein